MRALLHATLGGNPWPELALCLVLAVTYGTIGVLILDRFMDAARRSATLSLT
jgi:hypothetical protein